jgi:hypothetical protein
VASCRDSLERGRSKAPFFFAACQRACKAVDFSRRGTASCCPRTTTGHAAALPSPAMNSRRSLDHLVGRGQQRFRDGKRLPNANAATIARRVAVARLPSRQGAQTRGCPEPFSAPPSAWSSAGRAASGCRQIQRAASHGALSRTRAGKRRCIRQAFQPPFTPAASRSSRLSMLRTCVPPQNLRPRAVGMPRRMSSAAMA